MGAGAAVNIWIALLIVVWVAGAAAIAIMGPDSKGCLAYRLTGDAFMKFIGRFFTALHWPLLVPILAVILIADFCRPQSQ